MDIGAMANDLYQGYRNFQNSYPVIGSMLTAEVLFPLADGISQLVKDRKVDLRKIIYTAKLAPVYGLFIEGLVETGELVGEYISSYPLAKAALGPNFFGNLFNVFFFVNNTVGEKTGYSIRELVKNYYGAFFCDSSLRRGSRGFWENFREKIVSNIPRKEFLYATIGTVTAWNGVQYVNYAFIPEEMRTQFALGALFIWVNILSLWSLVGRRRVVGRIED